VWKEKYDVSLVIGMPGTSTAFQTKQFVLSHQKKQEAITQFFVADYVFDS